MSSSIALQQNYGEMQNWYFLPFHFQGFEAPQSHLVAVSFQSLFMSDVLLTDKS